MLGGGRSEHEHIRSHGCRPKRRRTTNVVAEQLNTNCRGEILENGLDSAKDRLAKRVQRDSLPIECGPDRASLFDVLASWWLLGDCGGYVKLLRKTPKQRPLRRINPSIPALEDRRDTGNKALALAC